MCILKNVSVKTAHGLNVSGSILKKKQTILMVGMTERNELPFIFVGTAQIRLLSIPQK